jgi:hypothetical protein
MAEIEHPEKYSWWLNDAVKQTLYEEYLHQAYSGK